jgi:K+-transporting ATPase ATPase B chain
MTTTVDEPPDTRPGTAATAARAAVFGPRQLLAALPGALRKLHPRHQVRNPVMFVVWTGSVLSTVFAVADPAVFTSLVTAWLWVTVLFANLAEAVAEGRGRAQAESLRRTRKTTTARRLVPGGGGEVVPGADLRVGDLVVVAAGEVIPGDGDVVEGLATVDESAVTGESAPVIRESGGDFSSVTGGTTVLSDRIVVRITTRPGESFVDRMIALVEGARRQKTPNEVALTILLSTLTIIFLLAVVSLQPVATYAGGPQPVVVLTALLVCLIPTTIGALLSAIGIAGMDRLVRRNVLATSGRAVEAAGDVSTLLLDKTGTITFGNRRATELVPVGGATVAELTEAARLASLGDDTPEGRSVLGLCGGPVEVAAPHTIVPFTARTRASGIDISVGTATGTATRRIRKGAASGFPATDETRRVVAAVSGEGGTPLVVADDDRVLGVIRLSDVVKPAMRERFAELRRMGIRTVMITGDNPATARAIAERSGVDDYLAEATPEDKLALIRAEQEGGRLVAMTGDGTNDAPALAQSDVGVAMNSGTAAAKEAGNMVDLDSDPTKLIEIVAIGKQLLITRGALMTFSVANDLAKYFAILPAMFTGVFPQLAALNVMGLHSPGSAIASAVVFNALVIVALIPLALRGVRYRPLTAAALLRRNLLVYGLGGVLTPFAGIWLIDLVVRLVPGM